MNGILAQTAALAAHARVRDLDVRLCDESYWAAHSTFRYVGSLTFKVLESGLFRKTERAIASTPAGWLKTLPANAAISLVSVGASGGIEPHRATAFLGGTHEGIAVHEPGRGTLWISSWGVVGQHPDTGWAVTYVGKKLGVSAAANRSLEAARNDLSQALGEISDFALCDPELRAWQDTFARAQDLLDSPEPIAPYHSDILPPVGYSLAGRQLLASSVAGFVFGGMGSWNDYGFSDRELQARYERVTSRLYAAVLDGIVASVNEGAS